MSTFTPEQEAIMVIQEINKETSHTWLVTKLGNSILFLGEIFFYILLLGFVFGAFIMPSGEIPVNEQVNNGVTVSSSIQIDGILKAVAFLKGVVIFAGLTMMIPAFLFRKIRKKNNKLEKVYNLTNEYLKKQTPATKA